MPSGLVETVGLDALGRDFARMPTDPAIKAAFGSAGTAALEPVMNAARSALPHDTGRLAGTLSLRRNKLGATLSEGARTLYAGPVDFGGYPEGRDYVSTGRYLFPAAMGLSVTANERYTATLNSAMAAYRWTNSGGTPHD